MNYDEWARKLTLAQLGDWIRDARGWLRICERHGAGMDWAILDRYEAARRELARRVTEAEAA